ncbi:UrcA family protein [Novosphingobium sp.]|uniref:UrcA family protein n=1 Tax=Novosphingobium sp. TaxID=1874826 RepID=UPI002628A248|nr:UrcA family protein [Novosphingobium sp.]
MTNRIFFASAFVLASALAPTLATAAPANGMETKVAVVHTSDLNLASDEGQSTLDARITSAVNRVCGTATGSIGIEERRAIAVCRTKARNSALAVARPREDKVLAQR